jgi:hypothetical protein
MSLLANLRYTFRQMTNHLGFFAVAVAALALGIGANTAIFSAVEAVLLRALPYSKPDRLVIVWEDMSFIGFANNTPAPANYLDWQARNHVFTDMAATRFVTASLTGDGQPEQLSGKKVTPNFFDVLGVQPVVGRPLTAEEDKAQTPVVVLGYNLWRRRFGGDESLIGRSILLNGVQTKVVGVMPLDFFFGDRKNSDYWVPMAFTPEQWSLRQTHFLTVVARNDALYREVTPGYLEMLGVKLKEGRLLEESDHEGGSLAVVVNEFLAKRHWPGKSAVGKRIRFGDEKAPWWMVVGVIRDIRERGLLYEMKPAVYVSVTQVKKPEGFAFLVVRTSNDPLSTIKMVEGAVWAVDPQQPVSYVRTMDQLMEADVADRTRPMILLGMFAGLALVLACIGVYGVLAYAVAQRTREIGVRMALGAKPMDVTRMILERGMKLSAIGLFAGGALAAGLGVLLRKLLYGVTPVAPGIYAGTAAALVFVAMVACVIPAQRAARVDPAVALRNE